jgi:hypothetical protein
MVKSPETAKQMGKSRRKHNLYLVATLVALTIVSLGVSIPPEQADARPCNLTGHGLFGTCSDIEQTYMGVGMGRGNGWGVHFVGLDDIVYDDH